MKILWIDLNSSYAHSSLALPALHAQIMTDPSIEWEIVSATINENTGMIVDEIYRHRPDILAATTWLFNHEQLMHVASRVKALLPEACLVLGGPEFLGDNEEFLRKNPFVDCVFRGEGEEVFPQWLTCWNHPEQWHTVPGLCYLTPNKEYKDNGIARVLNFAGLVPPEQSRFFNWSKPFVQLETTRGCFNTCAFCVSGGEKPVRTLSIESIRERLQLIHAHGIKNVRVLDRTFNYNPRRAKELLRLFLEFHPDIRFHLEIHPALLSEELKEELSLLPKGLLHLEAGIQSHMPVVLFASLPDELRCAGKPVGHREFRQLPEVCEQGLALLDARGAGLIGVEVDDLRGAAQAVQLAAVPIMGLVAGVQPFLHERHRLLRDAAVLEGGAGLQPFVQIVGKVPHLQCGHARLLQNSLSR